MHASLVQKFLVNLHAHLVFKAHALSRAAHNELASLHGAVYICVDSDVCLKLCYFYPQGCRVKIIREMQRHCIWEKLGGCNEGIHGAGRIANPAQPLRIQLFLCIAHHAHNVSQGMAGMRFLAADIEHREGNLLYLPLIRHLSVHYDAVHIVAQATQKRFGIDGCNIHPLLFRPHIGCMAAHLRYGRSNAEPFCQVMSGKEYQKSAVCQKVVYALGIGHALGLLNQRPGQVLPHGFNGCNIARHDLSLLS